MKRFAAFLLMLALVCACMPVFATETAPAVTLTVEDAEVETGCETVEVTITYDTAEFLLDGGFIITFPADKLELIVGEKTGPSDPANKLSPLPNKQVNVANKDNGEITVVFADANGSVTGEGVLAKLPFKILDPSVEAEYAIEVKADRLVKWVEGNTAGENLVSEETPIEAAGSVFVCKPYVQTFFPAIPDVTVDQGAEQVNVAVTYETTDYILDGGFEITFPADKLELIVGEKTGPSDPANALSPLPNKQVNVEEKENGKILVVFADANATVTGQGVIAHLPFKLLDPDALAEYEITVKAVRLVKWVDGVVGGENLISERHPLTATGKVTVQEGVKVWGDVDGDGEGDGEVTTTDARMILQVFSGKLESDTINARAADVDGDGKVTSTDARLVLQYVVGKITEFPRG